MIYVNALTFRHKDTKTQFWERLREPSFADCRLGEKSLLPDTPHKADCRALRYADRAFCVCLENLFSLFRH